MVFHVRGRKTPRGLTVDLSRCAAALWRATTYLSVAQLHLRTNPLPARLFHASDVKLSPSGHWGTVPGTAWALIHVGLAAGRWPDVEVVPIIGAGHAGVVQRALAWITGDLAKVDARLREEAMDLATLVDSFPDSQGLGSEVHPAFPTGAYMGGWLGGALAFAQGMALDAANRVVVPIIGDGECETPTTAASWLAQRSIPGASVFPVVHLNGYRMGGPSLLGGMSDEQVCVYAQGLGWEPVIQHVRTGDLAEHAAFQQVVADGIDATRQGDRRVVFLRCVKGWSGPVGAHKTPLIDLSKSADQRAQLTKWMSSYRPWELFDDDGRPVGELASALDQIRFQRPNPAELPDPPAAQPKRRGFSTEIVAVLREHAGAGDFKVFSPDELGSNHLGELVGEPWVHEVLAEEVLLGWLAGWTASGRRGVLISYEAFGTLLLTGLVGHLKQRRLLDSALPSINLFLTSYGWHNVYTHGDPSLVTALLGIRDPAVRVFTPADADRAAIALDDAIRSTGMVNIIVAGKHATPSHPLESIGLERLHGLAIWNHLSDPGEPDLTLLCAGDLTAAVVSQAVALIRQRHKCRLRVVNVHELTALAGPTLHSFIGQHARVLVLTVGHPSVIWGLLAARLRQVEVLGWCEPPHPMPQDGLAAHSGLDVGGIIAAAEILLASEVS